MAIRRQPDECRLPVDLHRDHVAALGHGRERRTGRRARAVAAAVRDRVRARGGGRRAAWVAACARDGAAHRDRELHHDVQQHADGGADSVHPLDHGLRLRAQGRGGVSLLGIRCALQHHGGCPQREARTARGGALVSLQRMAAVARRDAALHPAIHVDRYPAGHRPWSRRHGGGRILPERVGHREADYRERARFRHRGRAGRDHRDHHLRHGVDEPRAGGRKPLRRMAGIVAMSDAVALPAIRRRAWAIPGGNLGIKIAGGLVIAAGLAVPGGVFSPPFGAQPIRLVMAIPSVLSSPQFLAAAWSTLWAVAQGLVVAVVIGTVVGLAMGRMRTVDRAFAVYVNGLNAMPMVAVLPLLTLWFGYTGDARMATIVFAAFFAIALNMADGARAVPPEYLQVPRSYPANWP